MTARAGEFRAGWRVLAASCLGIAIGVSSLYFYSLGIFLKPLATEFGWSRAEASLGALVGTVCAAIMALPTGRLVDRIGSVRVAIGSLLLLALGFATLGALTVGLASFLALTMLLSLLTAGATPLPFTRLIVSSFARQRGLALGLALSGTGFGAILIPAQLPQFIAMHGWRAGYFALAGLIIVVLPIVVILLRTSSDSRARAVKLKPVAAIVASKVFILLGVIFVLASIAVFGSVVHFHPMLTDAGLSPARAGAITALIGVAAIGGRLVTGWLLDRLSPERVTASMFAMVACGLLTLAIGGVGLAMPGAAVVGLAVGAEVDLMAFLTARHFRRADYGQTYGALYALFLGGGAIGPVLGGHMFDVTGNYRLWLMTAAAALGLAAMLAIGLSKFSPLEESAQ